MTRLCAISTFLIFRLTGFAGPGCLHYQNAEDKKIFRASKSQSTNLNLFKSQSLGEIDIQNQSQSQDGLTVTQTQSQSSQSTSGQSLIKPQLSSPWPFGKITQGQFIENEASTLSTVTQQQSMIQDPMEFLIYLPKEEKIKQQLPLILFLHGHGDGPFHIMQGQSLPRLINPDKCWDLDFQITVTAQTGTNLDSKTLNSFVGSDSDQDRNNCTFFSKGGNFPYPVLMPKSGKDSSNWINPVYDQVMRLTRYVVRSIRFTTFATGSTSISSNTVINPLKVVLIGQSAGGKAVWDLSSRYPLAFSAIVPICTAGIGQEAKRKWTNNNILTRLLPVWLVHSDDDIVVPVEISDEMYKELKKRRSYSGTNTDTVGVNSKTVNTESDLNRPNNQDFKFNNFNPKLKFSKVKPIQVTNEIVYTSLSDSQIPEHGDLRYTRYINASGPPMEEYSSMIGHASYDLIFRDSELYRWIERQTLEGRFADMDLNSRIGVLNARVGGI